MNASPHDFAATQSLLAFWRDAGVEACYEDAPVDRTYVAPLALKVVEKATASVTPLRQDNGDAIAEARRLAAGAETLEALAQAVATFEACPLSGMGASQAVFERGDPTAPILIIGEAPGADEDARGEAFSGKSGRLLDRMIEAAGLTGKVFITYTVFWRPPGDRPPTPQEQAICAPFVQRVLSLVQPKAVLLLGAATTRSVLQTDDSIMKLRGQWKTWRLAEGDVSAPVLPTLNPAFLLRHPQAKREAWADLLALAASLDGEASEAPTP